MCLNAVVRHFLHLKYFSSISEEASFLVLYLSCLMLEAHTFRPLAFCSACTCSCTRSKAHRSRRRTRARPGCSRTGSRWTTECSSPPRGSSSPSHLLCCKCLATNEHSALCKGWAHPRAHKETSRVERDRVNVVIFGKATRWNLLLLLLTVCRWCFHISGA